MTDVSDLELLRDYDRQGSEEAFATVVERHVSLVYSVALRQVGIPTHAEEITQAVFIILARKAGSLRAGTILEGWLHETTRLTALSFKRGERRRQFREQEAYMQSTLQETMEASNWNEMAPLLDEAVSRLGKKDRDALMLRFFKNQSLREVALALEVNEMAAQRRVHRAVEKLRHLFKKRGVILPAAAVTAAISANSVQAAPVALAKSVTAAAVTKGAAASVAVSTLIKGGMKLMAWSKTQAAIVAGVGLLLAAGTATTLMNEFGKPTIEDVFKHYQDDNYLKKAPPTVILRPSKYARQGDWVNDLDGPPPRFLGGGRAFGWVLATAYNAGFEQMVLPPDMPTGRFDYLVTVPKDPRKALQEEIRRQFGLVGNMEDCETNVLVLKVVNSGSPALKLNKSKSDDQDLLTNPGHLKATGVTMAALAAVLGPYYVNMPVIDDTGLRDEYDFDLQWDSNKKGPDQTGEIERMLGQQLGLELVPERRAIPMLMVEYEGQHQVAEPLPKASWSFEGYGTPEAAFESALSAMKDGDLQKYLASLTPGFQKRFLTIDERGATDDQIIKDNKHHADEIVAFQIVTEEMLSDEKAVLFLRSTRRGNGMVTMEKIGGDWKMAEDIH